MSDMLTTAEFAAARGVDVRTVKRWLERDRIVGAEREGKFWRIPADAPVRMTNTAAMTVGGTGTGGAPVPRTAAVAAAAPASTLTAILDASPVYLDLATASGLLGIPVGVIRKHREEYELVARGGDNGQALVMPQYVIRRLIGA